MENLTEFVIGVLCGASLLCIIIVPCYLREQSRRRQLERMMADHCFAASCQTKFPHPNAEP